MRILIANRGEIARRIIRTAHRMGLETVAAYSDADERAPFVSEATLSRRLGPADAALSYLSIDAVLAAAEASDADAIHPGYGFLSENTDFATTVVASGRIWIGPRPETMALLGSKIEARRLAAAADIPIIPGYDHSQDPRDLAQAAEQIGYPVLIKASAGGGGRGIRIVDQAGQFEAALNQAQAEAERAFGDGAVIVERYIQHPRHIEVQIAADHYNNVVHLGTRECSVQRRYQKLLEEAPAPNLPDATRSGLETAAVALGQAAGYDSVGTVEFVVDDQTGDYFFLEVNTRLQVEHPVTELITGLDLVEIQISIAAKRELPISQHHVCFDGHAFEARINAENPAIGFQPQIGTIGAIRVPDWVRWDSAVEPGSEITPHYDSMIAKVICSGPDRDTARKRLGEALDETIITGPITTAGFHRWLVEQPPIVAGRVTTRFLDDTALPEQPDPPLDIAAQAWLAAERAARQPDPWHAMGPFRTTPHRSPRQLALRDSQGEVHRIEIVPEDNGDGRSAPDGPWPGTHLSMDGNRFPVLVDRAGEMAAVNVAGHTHTFTLLDMSELWSADSTTAGSGARTLVAPFPAAITELNAKPGDRVSAGDTIVVLEAMKMFHTLAAPAALEVAEVRVNVGDQVDTGQVLVVFHSPTSESRIP
ncbi:acetyl/propionyl/methylcrotonyl-CoA carboxylase subunit alpha [Candidatus Poriferisocius sp.]|uniref:acetyl/propionyl/methylcrotonyl-CoA carboxylase subunit alpha n=1 Tax=Candidatus Poriferisocius sp. TaxID=3101276 RepID=UPI003B01BB2D